MPTRAPKEDEFEWRENVLVHKPTGASWTPSGGGEANYGPSTLGSNVGDGDKYREYEVIEMAKTLLVKRHTK